ncbi:MAG: lysophospholipid acyltransferase family protein [Anaerolineaceae bacterium]|nr:lysophospholipid acyltransferase family protein [Anaerolineaceae bacterium]
MSLSYYLYRLAGLIVPQVPAKLGYALCRWCAGVAYQVNRPVRRVVSLNLHRIMGPQTPVAEIERRTRLTFNTIFYNYFDLFRLPRLSNEVVERLVTVVGWEHVETALAEGKGIVMTSAHLGNIEVVLYAMLRRGLSITIPVERIEPPELFDYITALRTSHGLKLIPIDRPLIDLIRTLKKQGVAGLAADRDITGTGPIVDFFGYPAQLPDGHIRLALRTGAPLVVGFSRRQPDHRYEAYFLPPYHPPASGSEEERVTVGMNFILAEMEKAIAQTPEQWTVTVPVWTDQAQPSL